MFTRLFYCTSISIPLRIPQCPNVLRHIFFVLGHAAQEETSPLSSERLGEGLRRVGRESLSPRDVETQLYCVRNPKKPNLEFPFWHHVDMSCNDCIVTHRLRAVSHFSSVCSLVDVALMLLEYLFHTFRHTKEAVGGSPGAHSCGVASGGQQKLLILGLIVDAPLSWVQQI